MSTESEDRLSIALYQIDSALNITERYQLALAVNSAID